jgi:hypothetical protein
MGKLIDLTGKTFGRLTVTNRDETILKGLPPKWICICSCGISKSILGKHLRGGETISCGCCREEKNYGNNYGLKHGMHGTVEYNSWDSMVQRCSNPNNNYSDYGGRGITVCDRWLESFKNFYEDMGPRPSDIHSIDRIDVNGNYEPSNCRWATPKEQARNKRNIKIKSIEDANEIRKLYKTGKYLQRELAEMYNCSDSMISNIINDRFWVNN